MYRKVRRGKERQGKENLRGRILRGASHPTEIERRITGTKKFEDYDRKQANGDSQQQTGVMRKSVVRREETPIFTGVMFWPQLDRRLSDS